MPVLVSALRRLGVDAPVLTEYAEVPLFGGGLPVGGGPPALVTPAGRRPRRPAGFAARLAGGR